MLVRPSQNVQISGLCQGEYLESWQRKPEVRCKLLRTSFTAHNISQGRNLVDLLQALQAIFSREPPLHAKPPPSAQQTRQQPSPGPSSPVSNGQRYARPPPQPPLATSSPATPSLPAKPMSAVAQGKAPLRSSTSLAAPGQTRPLSAHQLDPSPYAQPSRMQSPPHTATPAYYPPQNAQNPHRAQSLSMCSSQQYHQPTSANERQPDTGSPMHAMHLPHDPRVNGLVPTYISGQQPHTSQSTPQSPVSSPPPVRPTRPAELRQASAAAMTSKTAPQRSMSTPINILDQDDTPSPSAQGSGPVSPTPPRPLNPELLNLRRAMYAHITYHRDALRAHLHADNQSLSMLHADLQKGEPAIRDEMARLEAVRDVCANVRDRYRAVVQEAEQRTAELNARDLPEVDELVCGTNIVHNQWVSALRY